MTDAVFADTFYYIALLDPRGQAHSRALELVDDRSIRQVTTEFVLLELADGFAGRDKQGFLKLLARLDTDDRITIHPISSELYQSGLARYRQYRDKAWTLTDCIS